MRKIALVFIVLNLFCFWAYGQETVQHITDMRAQLAAAKTDTAKIQMLLLLAEGYRFSKLDSARYLNNQAIELAHTIGNKEGEADALSNLAQTYLDAGNIPKALDYLYRALRVAGGTASAQLTSTVNNRLGNVYMELGEYKMAIKYYRISQALIDAKKAGLTNRIYNALSNIGNVYEMMGQLDSAYIYQQMAYKGNKTGVDRYVLVRGEMRQRLGNIESRLGHYSAALDDYKIGVKEATFDNDSLNLSVLYLQMAKLFAKMNQPDSGFYYARKTIATANSVSTQKSIYEASLLLSGLFKQTHQPDSALVYAEKAAEIKDKLYGPKIFQQLELITFNEQQRQQQLQDEKEQLQNTYRMVALFSALGVFLLIAIILWRNNRSQKKANKQLSEQKEEILTQRDELGQTLGQLKSTQTQLIQSEKLASLGELTAGIAHEIQNPLNFVNNFSEVNTELIDELLLAIENKDPDEIRAIAIDIKENETKINMHGKRADGIVKGMLQHSKIGSGTKEPTDINNLADEFMRLAYHGLRAKDKLFNAESVTNFDENLPKVNIAQQDIGRVLLNLFNNAFYAVNQKQKTAGDDYKPEVTVTTSIEKNSMEISVKDNGNGIPDAIKDKIMQPFFTTKPTGEGTGLGLSLSYDIVVKGHGGSITVDSKENEFTEFTVTLPI